MQPSEDREDADDPDSGELRFKALDRALFAPSGDGVQARTALFERDHRVTRCVYYAAPRG
jgi:hypothetical protein